MFIDKQPIVSLTASEMWLLLRGQECAVAKIMVNVPEGRGGGSVERSQDRERGPGMCQPKGGLQEMGKRWEQSSPAPEFLQ